MTTTPNMGLVLPDVSTTIGPDWADELNTAFSQVDLHDHSTGFGVPVTPAGMSINTDLPFGSNNATLLRSIRLITNIAAHAQVTDLGCVYNINGDLYYNNNTGTPVQITSGSAIVSAGSGLVTSKTPSSYPYTILTSDAQKVLLVNTSAARTLNLPAATTNMYVMVKDITGSALTNNISVAPNGTDTIEGVNAAFILTNNRGSLGFVSDGVSAWYVI